MVLVVYLFLQIKKLVRLQILKVDGDEWQFVVKQNKRKKIGLHFYQIYNYWPKNVTIKFVHLTMFSFGRHASQESLKRLYQKVALICNLVLMGRKKPSQFIILSGDKFLTLCSDYIWCSMNHDCNVSKLFG